MCVCKPAEDHNSTLSYCKYFPGFTSCNDFVSPIEGLSCYTEGSCIIVTPVARLCLKVARLKAYLETSYYVV